MLPIGNAIKIGLNVHKRGHQDDTILVSGSYTTVVMLAGADEDNYLYVTNSTTKLNGPSPV
jgi:hypothetical protein